MLHLAAPFHADAGPPIRSLTRVIVRCFLTNFMLSVVLARVRLNKQTDGEKDVLIVELITIINCMHLYVTQGLKLNEAYIRFVNF
jgi:hypothetical protein